MKVVVRVGIGKGTVTNMYDVVMGSLLTLHGHLIASTDSDRVGLAGFQASSYG